MPTEMTQSICNRCQQPILRVAYTGDFQHICTGAEVLQNEDVPVIGNWTDYTGSDLGVANAMMQGTENTLWGTRAALEGAKNFRRTSRGFPVNTFRTRQHIQQLDDDYFKKKDNSITPDDPEEYEDEHI